MQRSVFVRMWLEIAADDWATDTVRRWLAKYKAAGTTRACESHISGELFWSRSLLHTPFSLDALPKHTRGVSASICHFAIVRSCRHKKHVRQLTIARRCTPGRVYVSQTQDSATTFLRPRPWITSTQAPSTADMSTRTTTAATALEL